MASGSADIRIRTATRIRTMGADIHIGPTDIMDRHFTGTAVIEPTTRGLTIDTITGVGSKLKTPGDFRGRRVKSPAGFYFFGDEEPAGADVVDGNGS